MNNNIKHTPIVGATYGQWTIISTRTKDNGSYDDRNMYWHVRCSCGSECFRAAYTLVNGKTKACKSCSRTTYDESTYVARYFNWRKSRIVDEGFECNIDIKYLEELLLSQDNKCAISGVAIGFESYKERNKSTASLDRIDSTLGYIKGNVQWVHKDVNMAKGTMNQQSFINMCRVVTEYQSKC